MFVTMPQFEQTQMSQMAGQGQKYWRAVTAHFPVEPWYLFVYEAQVADARVLLTMLVAWEESLLDVIKLVPPNDRRAVYRVQRAGSGVLSFKAVRGLWAPTSEEVAEGLGAVLSLEGESGLLDPNLRPVSQTQLRQVVYQDGSSAAPGADHVVAPVLGH
jgi:hypothetical protein